MGAADAQTAGESLSETLADAFYDRRRALKNEIEELDAIAQQGEMP